MKQAIAYVRVSSKEQKQEGYSIPAQKKLLWDFAKANGFKVVKEFEDDETAKNAGRTGFGEMVELLQKDEKIDTILVEKTDRLYRNFKDYVTIDELGVTVFLVKENEKLGKDASSHQKFIHGIKVLMAKNYIDNLSEEVKKGFNQKVASGVYPCNNLPLGYTLGKKDGKSVPIVDEKNRLLVVKMFEYYSTGLYSVKRLLSKLREENLLIPANFPKSSRLKDIKKSTGQRILRNPFYYGDFLWKGKIYHGNQEPLISRELWDKVQSVLSRIKNKTMVGKFNSLTFAFKGLIRCGECGRTITAERKIKPSGKEYVYYKCTKYETNCSQKPVSETILDEQVIGKLNKLRVPTESIPYIAGGLKDIHGFKKETIDKTKQALIERKLALEEQTSTMYDDRLDGTISKETYNQKFPKYEKEIKDLDEKIIKYTKADINYYQTGVGILELANLASLLYKNAVPAEKQKLLNFLLSDSNLADKNLSLNYNKPFQSIYKRVCLAKNPFKKTRAGATIIADDAPPFAQMNEWRGRRDSNARPSA